MTPTDNGSPAAPRRTTAWREDLDAIATARQVLQHPVGSRTTDEQLIMAANLGTVGRLARSKPFDGKSIIPIDAQGRPIVPSLSKGFDEAIRPRLRKPRRLLDPRTWFRGAAAVLPARVERLHRLPRKLQLDQDGTPQCVAYCKKHWELANPIGGGKRRPPAEDYLLAKQRDGFPGQDGTTGTAMLGVAEDQGIVESSWYYTGPDDLEALHDWLLHWGSLWFGANWTEAMFRASPTQKYPNGLLTCGEGQPFIYGHQTLLLGTNRRRRTLTDLNSWGNANWGVEGRAEIPDAEFARLMDPAEGWGDIIGVVERRIA
jgi:hypothetical protein